MIDQILSRLQFNRISSTAVICPPSLLTLLIEQPSTHVIARTHPMISLVERIDPDLPAKTF